MIGVLFEDPDVFVRFRDGGYLLSLTVDTPDVRTAVRIAAPLVLGLKPELWSQPGSMMATWIAVFRVHGIDADPPEQWWAAMFERGSLEGIKLRELCLVEETFAAYRNEEIEGGMVWDRLLRAMAAEPLAWFPL